MQPLFHNWFLLPIKLPLFLLWLIVKVVWRSLYKVAEGIWWFISYPFRSWKNLFKYLLWVGVSSYIVFSFLVMDDYVQNRYSSWDNYWCAERDMTRISDKVVRVVGGYSEGSGFFISPNQIVTNFHVIDYEPSPKIILADGEFLTPTKIVGDQEADIAILTVDGDFSDKVFNLENRIEFDRFERAWAIGYPLGTNLVGDSTILSGDLLSMRESSAQPVAYIQTNISLVEGMSGGPLVNVCGELLGVNTLGLAGLSLFIAAPEVNSMTSGLTDEDITKIEVDPTLSSEDAVYAFYTYLKTRRMEDGYALLSNQYLEKTNFEEWTGRFTDVLDVNIYYTKAVEDEPLSAFVKFSTKNWVNQEVVVHYYEGIWETVKTDEVYKMYSSSIKEVDSPEWDWFYDFEEE